MCQNVQGHQRIAEAPPPALDVPRQLLRQFRREAEARHVEERLAIDDAEIDPAGDAIGDDIGGAVEIEGNAERSREVVGRAHRQDPQGQSRLDDAEGRRIDGAVAAPDDGAIHVPRMLHDERRQVLPPAAIQMNGLDAMILQALHGDVALGGAAAALGVDDQKGAAWHEASHGKA